MYDIIYSMKKKNGDKTRKEHGGHPNWKPGESGNLKGRPKGSISITTVMKRLLQKIVKTQDGTSKQRVETLASNILGMALNERNEAMIKLVWNYIDGLPKQSTKIEIEGELPVRVISIKKYEPKRTNRNRRG